MWNTRQVYIPFLTGVAGCLIGALGISSFWSRGVEKLGRNSNEANAGIIVHQLQLLRQEKYPVVIGAMEVQLDGYIVSLNNALLSSPSNANEIQNVLNKIKEYRAQYPFANSSSAVKAQVEQIMSSK